MLIIGISGACRTDELTNMEVNNVVDKNDMFVIRLPDTKTNKQRTFTVCNNPEKENYIDMVSVCRKYFNLRPKHMASRRLFVRYNLGRCSAQNVGHHTIGAIPYKIASYLGLENPKQYTGHCFRRSSTTLLADSGADLLTIKRHGGWKSSAVAESYIEESVQNKISITKKILATTSTTKPNADGKNEDARNCPMNEMEVAEAPAGEEPTYHETNIYTNNAPSTSNVTELSPMANLSKQGISFSSCKIENPIFHINISNK